MDATAVEAMMAEIAHVMRDYVAEQNAPLRQEIAELRAENEQLVRTVSELQNAPAPEPDTEATKLYIDKAIADGIGAAFATIELPKDGKDCDMEAVESMLADKVAKAVAEIPPAEPGRDADMDALATLVRESVERAVTAIPAPDAGKDGIGMADTFIDKDGNLIVTMTDGRTKNMGPIKGKDGATFTLDDFEIEAVDERTIKMKFEKDGVVHSFELTIPALIYRDVWREDGVYERGDMVTWGGSLWHCEEAKGLKPDAPDSGWRLAVKKGRDGKSAK